MMQTPLFRLTDRDLILLLQQGDETAFDEIYERYRERLKDAASKWLGSSDDAKDVVQEVFINLFMQREKLHITHSLEAYLYTAIKYKALNHVRSDSIRRKHLNKITTTAGCAAEPTPAKILHLKELNQQVSYTVASLPNKCRQVYLLSRREDFSYRDIANELSISVSTVEKHIMKALNILRTRLHHYQAP